MGGGGGGAWDGRLRSRRLGGSLGCWMGGWVNARGRRREGLREPGEAEVTGVGVVGAGGGAESFFHTQLS